MWLYGDQTSDFEQLSNRLKLDLIKMYVEHSCKSRQIHVTIERERDMALNADVFRLIIYHCIYNIYITECANNIWSVDVRMHSFGGLITTFTNLVQCKAVCISDSRCVGFDVTGPLTVPFHCWFFLDAAKMANKVFAPDVDSYELKRCTCKTNVVYSSNLFCFAGEEKYGT